MKTVLVIYPHWPPSNLVGVHRVRLLVNEMPALGWNPIVLTVDERDYENEGAPGSESLVDPQVTVIKVRAQAPLHIFGRRTIGDIGLRGWHAMQHAAHRILEEHSIDFIWFSLPSWYPCLFAPSLKRRHGVPYAIDYQDPWVHLPSAHFGPFHRGLWTVRLARMLEPRVLRSAAFVSAINQAYMEGPIHRTPGLSAKPNVAIQLGFSARDHEHRIPKIPTPWPEGKRALVYAGAYWDQGSPFFDHLLKAWRIAKLSGLLPPDAHLVFIGTGNPRLSSIHSKIQALGIENSAIEHPNRIPYLNVLDLLHRAHASVVLGSTAKHYSASKVFQLLIAKKPILAHLHAESEARDILRASDADAFFCPFRAEGNPADIKQLSECLGQIFQASDWRPNLAAIEQHSALNAARKLTAAFETALTR